MPWYCLNGWQIAENRESSQPFFLIIFFIKNAPLACARQCHGGHACTKNFGAEYSHGDGGWGKGPPMQPRSCPLHGLVSGLVRVR